jgi:hypothetical protein
LLAHSVSDTQTRSDVGVACSTWKALGPHTVELTQARSDDDEGDVASNCQPAHSPTGTHTASASGEHGAARYSEERQARQAAHVRSVERVHGMDAN